MIHRVTDSATGRVSYGTSAHEVWRPGNYADERAARYSFRFPDEILIELRERAKPGLITFAMLQQARARRCAIATIVADSSGNWSATGTWTGDAVPGANDIAQTGAYTVTIDQDITCTRIEATSSGHYEVTAGGITINAHFTMASSYATNGGLRLTHTTGTVTLNGNVIGGAQRGSANNAEGNLTVIGTIVGGSTATTGVGVRNVSTGTLTIGSVGVPTTITGGSATSALGVSNVGDGAVNIVGDLYGSTTAVAHALSNTGGGTCTVDGDAYGGTGSYGSYGALNNTNTGTINLLGSAIGGTDPDAYGMYNQIHGTVSCDLARAAAATRPPRACLARTTRALPHISGCNLALMVAAPLAASARWL